MPAPRPTIYLFGGCNGAGKTTFAREYLPSIGVRRFLNADEIARGLSPLAPEAAAFRAGRLLLADVNDWIARRRTFGFESTLSGKTYIALLQGARDQRYTIELHYLWLPTVN